jgi:hypothetical protein
VQLIVRKLARLVTTSAHRLARQHVKGNQNMVSDLLSFAGTVRGHPHALAPDLPTDHVLTQRFHTNLPQLKPKDFAISAPLPSEISSFLIQDLQRIKSSLTRGKKNPTRPKTEPGAASSPSAPKPASPLTLSLWGCSTKKTS